MDLQFDNLQFSYFELTRRLFYIVCLWLGVVLSLQAEVVLLRSGQVIKGEILLNNEEVVILRQKDGLRYQYPQTEVVSITEDSQIVADIDTTAVERAKVVDVGLSVYGGAAFVPHKGIGGTTDVQAMVGSHNLLNQRIFLGGSFGYRGVFVGEDTYSWIPVQLVLQTPIAISGSIEHKPLIGACFGYAFALNKEYQGGLCAGLDVGMLFCLNDRSSLSLSLTAQWQQAHIHVVETINKVEYTNFVGCNIVGLGIKFGLRF